MNEKAKTNDRILKKLHNIAYNYALYKVGSLDVAEDIASQTIYSYLLKRDQITHENHEGWIINASKNFCNQFFDLQKSEQKLQNVLKKNLAAELQQKISETNAFIEHEKNSLYEIVNDVKNSLTEKELETYIYYLQCNRKIKKMHRDSEESYSALRQRVSRINRKIKAETFQKMGLIATKRIITPQINNIIKKFLLRFKEHLEANSLDKMFYYFSKKDISDYNPQFNIKKVLDYDVELEDSIYIIHVIFTNKQDEDESFYFSFTVENNALKIIQPPTPHKEHYQLSPEDAEIIQRMIEKYPEDKKGVHHLPKDELAFLEKLVPKDD